MRLKEENVCGAFLFILYYFGNFKKDTHKMYTFLPQN